MKKGKKIIGIIMAVVMIMLSVIVVSKTLFNNTSENDNEEGKNIQGREQGVNPVDDKIISAIDGKEELGRYVKEYVKNNALALEKEINSLDEAYAEKTASKSDNTDIVTGADTDYYKNNDQTDGVTEGDITITDGKYIYVYSDNKKNIRIIEADNDKLKEVSIIDILDNLEENTYIYNGKIYVDGDKLVCLFNAERMNSSYINGYENFIVNDCAYFDSCRDTIIVLYDISERDKPVFINKITVDNGYEQSRMVGNHLYVMTQKSFYDVLYGYMEEYGDNEENKEKFEAISYEELASKVITKINGKEVPTDNIYCPDNEQSGEPSTCTVIALDINNNLNVTDSCTVIGSIDDVYVSEQFIYLFNRVSKTDDESKSRTYKELTDVIKFKYGDGNVEPYAKGNIDGTVNNQFSADEYDGYLRVVTTEYEYNVVYEPSDIEEFQDKYRNNVYVLDDKLNIYGRIEGLAEDESIYSARFMKDKGYFVTFRNTDPLFVVDFSKPDNPKILSELKVTGFSSYLHMWNDNLLLGIGMEANESGITSGVKLSMFDISDLNNTKEIAKCVEENTEAYEALNNYKEILVDENKNLIGLEMSKDIYSNEESEYADIENDNKDNENNIEESNSTSNNSEKSSNYEEYIGYSQYYVLYRYENNSFTEVLKYDYNKFNNLKFTEYDDYEKMYCDYRGLYIGNYLYIITMDKGVQAINLSDLSYGDNLIFN
ncbi:MAG: beta-propeller domain-containing protein [Lachnospiraceae bacterium]|nr:beta-propeller domain-containing protein [Clostridiales bacterium]MDY2606634.1 beta-propeller domain-containing protein [Lachnospiraceae bacterium]